MRRIAMIGALLAALFASSAATANAQYFYRGPLGRLRVAPAAPAYYYYGPRAYYGPYWGPGWTYYWW